MAVITTRHFTFSCESHINRTHHLLLDLVCQQRKKPNYCHVSLLRVRRTRLPLLLLSSNLLLHSNSLPGRHYSLLSVTHLLSLLRPRTSSLSPTMSSLNTTPPPPPPSESDSTKTNKVVIKGRVQGVFYRDWTVQNATELGLKGWVRNKRDGSVEALFSGAGEKVDEMIKRCRRGPPAACVTGLETFPTDEDPGNVFERRRTA